MFCGSCGATVHEGQKFCSGCGKPVGVEAMSSGASAQTGPQGRIRSHIRVLGILWLVLSTLRLIPGIAFLFVGNIVLSRFAPDVPGFVAPLMEFLGGLFLATGIAGFAAGWGLLERRPWARTLVLLLGVIALIDLPFGTAMGIYTLWVLLPAESEQEYRRMAAA